MSAVLRRVLHRSLLVGVLVVFASACSDDEAEPQGPTDGRIQVELSVAHTDGTTGVAAITYADHGGVHEVSAIATPWQTGTLDLPPGTSVGLSATSQAGDTANLTCTISIDGVDTTTNGPGSCTAGGLVEAADG